MNIKQLKNEDFINFIEQEVGFKIKNLRTVMTRSGGQVVVSFEEPDNGFSQTLMERFIFTNTSCKRQNNYVGISNLTEKWLTYIENLKGFTV